jgi:uncharacterized protein (DUF1697 family)
MPRYVAFLRAVSPMNANMGELRRCFERAGFTNVKTVLASGNVVFDARPATEAALARKAEAAMAKELGGSFATIVRSVSALRKLLADEPFSGHRLPAKAKRVVTFLREPHKAKLAMPVEKDGARILARKGREVFTAYVPGARGGAFMRVIEKTFGKSVTTRTWDTIRKCAAA